MASIASRLGVGAEIAPKGSRKPFVSPPMSASTTERRSMRGSRQERTTVRHDGQEQRLLRLTVAVHQGRSSGRQFDDRAARRRRIDRPGVHELMTLVEQIASPISRLGLVSDRMGKRHLADIARKARLLGRPVAKGRSKTMTGDFQIHATKCH